MALRHYQNCDVLIEMEIEFLRFYHFLIADSLRKTDFESKKQFLEKVRDAYCKYSLQNGVSDISFNSSGMRSAYIFSSAPCFTGNVFYHFLNLIHSNPWFIKKVIAQRSLTISSLGGGPGAEVLAIAKALELNLKMFCSNIGTITINANIIDIDPGWKNTLKLITQKWWKFFDRNFIRLNISFMQFDLTQELSEDVRDIVRRSDLVTMVHFVSAVYGTKCREKISKMLQVIFKQSLKLYLHGYFKNVVCVEQSVGGYEIINITFFCIHKM